MNLNRPSKRSSIRLQQNWQQKNVAISRGSRLFATFNFTVSSGRTTKVRRSRRGYSCEKFFNGNYTCPYCDKYVGYQQISHYCENTCFACKSVKIKANQPTHMSNGIERGWCVTQDERFPVMLSCLSNDGTGLSKVR